VIFQSVMWLQMFMGGGTCLSKYTEILSLTSYSNIETFIKKYIDIVTHKIVNMKKTNSFRSLFSPCISQVGQYNPKIHAVTWGRYP